MARDTPLTATTLAGAASSVLDQAGYQLLEPGQVGEWPRPGPRVYEDPYSVVALLIYETWGDLSSTWTDAQAALVELISRHFSRGEAKAWEGYLVLLTPSVVPVGARSEALSIQRNTTHVRKLLASGDELREVGDVARVLLPLLPLEAATSMVEPRSALDLLPDLLSRRGIDAVAVRTAIQAFLDQQSVIERLHTYTTGEEEGPS